MIAAAESIKSLLAAAEGAAELQVAVDDAAAVESIKALWMGMDADHCNRKVFVPHKAQGRIPQQFPLCCCDCPMEHGCFS